MFEQLDRRDLLRSVFALAGATAVAPGVLAKELFSGPASLPPKAMALLTAIADAMIPATDTPGAVKAGVPAAFGKMMANWASVEQRQRYLGALDAIDAAAAKAKGASFAALSPAARFELLDGYDKALTGGANYAMLKQLLVQLYYLSEIGATVELRYEHVPGAWEPSIPVTAQTRAYATPNGV